MRVYLAILLSSIALFVLWGGPMWSAGAADSHLGRFVVSYGVIVPLSALALVLARTFSAASWITGIGTMWGIKLVITALLYFAFGPRGGMLATPASQRPSSRPAATAPPTTGATTAAATDRGYEAAAGKYEKADMRGRVMRGETPLAQALVQLVAPPPGLAQDDENDADLAVASVDAVRNQLLLASAGSSLKLNNDSAELRILFVTSPSGNRNRAPIPARGKSRVALNDIGFYGLSVGTSAASAGNAQPDAGIVVTDHPYLVRSNSDGSFELADVPAGKLKLRAWSIVDGTLLSAITSVDVTPAKAVEVELAVKPVAVESLR